MNDQSRSSYCCDGEHDSCRGVHQVPAGTSMSVPWIPCDCECHAVGSGTEVATYPRRMVSLEGRLELERIPSGCDIHVPTMVGLAVRNNGVANVGNVERDLWMLNGKDVRVTIEWRDAAGTEVEAKDAFRMAFTLQPVAHCPIR